jgi:transcriptional regulator with XRE-family HTH domain
MAKRLFKTIAVDKKFFDNLFEKERKKLAKEIGVSPAYLSQVMTGKRPASKKVLSKIEASVKQTQPDLPDGGVFVKILAHGPLAQLAEQLTLNQQVTGSIPVRLTN